MGKIAILISEDQKLVRETWAYILNNDGRFQVVGSCCSPSEAITLAKEVEPDVFLINIDNTPMSRIEYIQNLKQIRKNAKIIGVSMYSKPTYAKQIFKAGASGFLTMNSSKQEMIASIIEVFNGKKYISEDTRKSFFDQLFEVEFTNESKSISRRELQIINLVKEGFSSKQIAKLLSISIKTVEVHRHNILRKLKLNNSASLINYINNNEYFF